MSKYMNVGIPKAVAEEIKQIMGLLGYRSISEFVNEAARYHVTLKTMEYERRLSELADRKTRTETATF